MDNFLAVVILFLSPPPPLLFLPLLAGELEIEIFFATQSIVRLCNIGKREIDAYKNVKKMSLSARCRGQGNNYTRGEKRRTSN